MGGSTQMEQKGKTGLFHTNTTILIELKKQNGIQWLFNTGW